LPPAPVLTLEERLGRQLSSEEVIAIRSVADVAKLLGPD
jgi:acyl carrier protein